MHRLPFYQSKGRFLHALEPRIFGNREKQCDRGTGTHGEREEKDAEYKREKKEGKARNVQGDGRRLGGDKDGLIKIVTWKSEIDEKKRRRDEEEKRGEN